MYNNESSMQIILNRIILNGINVVTEHKNRPIYLHGQHAQKLGNSLG
jgi:hypothetical protein